MLDPFCGCGTTVDAAQQLGRKWMGIDVTYIAIDLIVKRLEHRYGDAILETFTTNGIPKDVESAEALFARNPFDFRGGLFHLSMASRMRSKWGIRVLTVGSDLITVRKKREPSSSQ